MTGAGVGDSNRLNLAALWVPIMPETSHMDAGARRAGEKWQREFAEGARSGGGMETMGTQMGGQFFQHFSNTFASKMSGVGMGLGTAFDKLTEQVDSQLAARLKGQLPAAFQAAEAATAKYEQALGRLQPVMQRHADLTGRMNELTAEHAVLQDKIAHTDVTSQNEKWNSLVAQSNRVLEERNKLAPQALAYQMQLNESTEKTAPLHEKATAAQEKYNSKLAQYSEASSHAFNMSSLFAGMLGGGIVLGIQGVVSGFERIIELDVHLFEEGIKGAKEMAEKLIEIGEAYQQLSIQTVEYSDETGPILEDLKDHVAAVFGQLDVAGKDLGKTYTQLGGMLGMTAGPELDEFARKVTDLQGRFSNLKAADVGAIFRVFKVGPDQINSALDTLAHNAQSAHIGLGDLVGAMKGDVAATMTEAGVSLGNAAYLTGQLEQAGLPAKAVMMGLNSAAKEVAKTLHTDYATGLREVIHELETATAPQRTEILEKYFTGRKWAEIAAVLPQLSQALNGVANAHDGAAGAAQNEIEQTEGLTNKLEALKHKAMDALKPFGEEAKNVVEEGLDHISKWFDEHHNDIIEKINGWGHTLIDNIPVIKSFVDAAVDMFGMLAQAMKVVADIGFDIAEVFATLTFQPGLAKRLNDAQSGMDKMDLGQIFGGIREQLDSKVFDPLISKSGQLGDALDRVTNSAMSTPDYFPNGVSQGAPGPSGMLPQNPVVPPTSSGALGSGGAAGGSGPGSLYGPGGGTTLGPGAGGGAGGIGFYHGNPVNWPAIAQAESSGNFRIDHGKGPDVTGAYQIATQTWLGEGGGQYAPKAYMASPDQQLDIAQKILNDYGPETQWPATYAAHPDWFGVKGAQTGGMSDDGGGIGNAPILGPISGNMWKGILNAGKGIGKGAKWLWDQNLIGPGMGPGRQSGGRGPKDTVPVWVTPKEYIWNEEAVEKYGPLIHGLNESAQGRGPGMSTMFRNAKGFDTGGAPGATDNASSGSPQFGGIPGAPSGQGQDIIDWLMSVVAQFNQQAGTNLQVTATYPGGPFGGHPDDGGDHSVFRALDIGAPGGDSPAAQQQMDAFANWWTSNPAFMAATRQLIHNDPSGGFASNKNVIGGGFTEGSKTYEKSPWEGHKNHVHLALQYIPGADGSAGGSATPSMAMGYGTPQYDQQRSRDKAVESANDSIRSYKREIEDKKQDIADLQKQVDDERGKPPALQDGSLPKKEKQLGRMKEDLDDLENRKLPEAEQNLNDAQSKALEPLKGSKGGRGGDKDGLFGISEQFGSGLLAGIGQELGLDVLGKSPLDWGITKLGMGLLNWGLNGFGAVPSSNEHGGLFGGGMLGGMAAGVGQSLGVNPRAGVSPTGGIIPQNQFGVGGTGIPGDAGRDPGPGGPSVHIGGDHIGSQINVYPSGDKQIAGAVDNLTKQSDYNAGMAGPALSGVGPGG